MIIDRMLSQISAKTFFHETLSLQRIGTSIKVLGFPSKLNVIETMTICTHGICECRLNMSRERV
jgi:hypothetical protein